ncbi:energy-coupling factor ABC transporter ATP-binding protein [Methanobrevibacter arboriphilus]|uniref:energy-coupling factor ABC transporter ATP-binding protein n=1 Tax=Methanobrevibacter arboriphilus TaxID=39441 RepID=UPI0006D0AAE2|nr:ATP-binding cassette domain-containing protein [Methanobrevibacter arboriphilus]
MTEHRINNVFPFIDKAVFIEEGVIAYNNHPREICLETCNNPIFSNYLPSTALIHFLFKEYYSFSQDRIVPLSIREGLNDMYEMNQEMLNNSKNTFYDEYKLLNEKILNETKSGGAKIDKNKAIFKCENLWFGYNKNQVIIKGVSFEIKEGEFISILGGNGTGKSTLLQLLVKILKPIKGKVKHDKKIKLGYVHQNPMIHFRFETVEEELNTEISEINSENKEIIMDKKEKKDLIEFFEIENLLKKHPYDCSGGEQQKIAIVKSLLRKPDILFLDEPTKGLDPIFKKNLGDKFQKLQKNGLSIVMVTHDIDFAADYSSRSFLIFDGKIQVDTTPPKDMFYNNNFYTTFVNRMVKNYIPNCVTLKDLKSIWKT